MIQIRSIEIRKFENSIKSKSGPPKFKIQSHPNPIHRNSKIQSHPNPTAEIRKFNHIQMRTPKFGNSIISKCKHRNSKIQSYPQTRPPKTKKFNHIQIRSTEIRKLIHTQTRHEQFQNPRPWRIPDPKNIGHFQIAELGVGTSRGLF